MEFLFESIDKPPPPPPPPPSAVSNFSDQPFRGPYAACSVPDFGRTAELFRNPSNGREAIQREIEKEKIRNEMIAAEIMRRRFQLEREMMTLEREMLAVRRPEGFSFLSASEFGPSVSVMNRSESRLTEERLAMSLEEELGYRNRYWIEEFETVPLHRCAEPRISEMEPSLEQGEPGENLSGGKPKALTLMTTGASELHSVDLKKKRKEWSCAICQVRTTSEQSLNDHFQGKKHKKAASGGKHYAIGFYPKRGHPI